MSPSPVELPTTTSFAEIESAVSFRLIQSATPPLICFTFLLIDCMTCGRFFIAEESNLSSPLRVWSLFLTSSGVSGEPGIGSGIIKSIPATGVLPSITSGTGI